MGRIRKPKYVEGFTDRLGRPRYYLRRPGFKRVPLSGLLWSAEFMDCYHALMGDDDAPARIRPGASRVKSGSLHAALAKYYASVAFTIQLAPASQRSRRGVLEKFAREHGEHNTVPRGERQLATLTRQALEKILGKMSPHPRRTLLKALRHFAQWAKADGLVQHDPTAGMKLARVPKTDGFYSWTERDVEKFEARHPISSKERLAFAIMLFLGLRRSDAIRIGPQHIRDGMVVFKPQKTERTTGFTLVCPVHPELARVIAATPLIGAQTFLVSERGRPFGASGFSGFMRKACNDAGLSECSSHGLRKACARRLADAGCDVVQISAITGHRDLRELQVYIADRDQRLAAHRAVAAMPGANRVQAIAKPPAQFGKTAKKLSKIK